MKKKFDFLMPVLTILSASFGIGIAWGVQMRMNPDSALTGLVSALAFFTVPVLTGYLGVQAALLLRRPKFVRKNSSGSLKALAAALLVSAVVGCAGQLLYAMEWQIETTETIVGTQSKGSHVVMLMDVSGSMMDERPGCVEAACQLIDGLDDTTSMQFIAFAAAVKDENVSAFAPMTAENKSSLQAVIRSANMIGNTNFNQPLEMAIETLEQNREKDYRNIIIMLTDGAASVKDSVKNVLADSDLELFTVRITDGANDSDADVQALIQLATQDFPVKSQPDGSVDVSAILKSLREALNSSRVITEEHKKLALGADTIFSANMEDFWWRPILQVVVFGLFSVLISLAYYGRQGLVSLVLNLASGVLCGVVLVEEPEFYPMLLIFLCFGAYTTYEIEEVPANV